MESTIIGMGPKETYTSKWDACVFYCGLNYFRDRDFTFKISRRFVWLRDFSLQLPEGDYMKSPLLTDWWVVNKNFQNNIAVATCCVGLFNAAVNQQHLNCIQNLSDTANTTDNFMQKAFRNVFSDFQNPVLPWRSVYVRRGYQIVSKDVLWWKRMSNWIFFYKKLSDQLGLHWSLRDFQV